MWKRLQERIGNLSPSYRWLIISLSIATFVILWIDQIAWERHFTVSLKAVEGTGIDLVDVREWGHYRILWLFLLVHSILSFGRGARSFFLSTLLSLASCAVFVIDSVNGLLSLFFGGSGEFEDVVARYGIPRGILPGGDWAVILVMFLCFTLVIIRMWIIVGAMWRSKGRYQEPHLEM